MQRSVERTKPRHVVFRISDEEHKILSEAYRELGVRSLSEFVRQAAMHYAVSMRARRSLLADDLATVTQRLEELDQSLHDLSALIGRVLGTSAKAAHGRQSPRSDEP